MVCFCMMRLFDYFTKINFTSPLVLEQNDSDCRHWFLSKRPLVSMLSAYMLFPKAV